MTGPSPAQWSQSVSATRATCLSQNFQLGPSMKQERPKDQHGSPGSIGHLLGAGKLKGWNQVAPIKLRVTITPLPVYEKDDGVTL